MRKLLRSIVSGCLLLASVFFVNKGVEAKPSDPKYPTTIQETKETTPLYLQHVRDLFEKDQGAKYTWHSSHRSHYSHQSHRSHYSHYSHYSGW